VKTTHIPGSNSFNITLSLDEVRSLSDDIYDLLYEDGGDPYPRLNLERLRDMLNTTFVEANKDLVEDIDRFQDYAENNLVERLLDQAEVMSFTEALLFLAKELKFVVYIDTEDEQFKRNKWAWEDAIHYETRRDILRRFLDD